MAKCHNTTGAAASPIRASLDRPLATPRAQDQNDRKTKTRAKTEKRLRRKGLRKVRPTFVARGSAPRSAPFLAPPLSLSLHPAPCGGRGSQFWLRAKEIIPPKRGPSFTCPLTPGSDCTSPTPSVGKMGGNPSAGENRREKQAGDVLPGPRKSLCCGNPACFLDGSCRGDRRRVVRGGRRS